MQSMGIARFNGLLNLHIPIQTREMGGVADIGDDPITIVMV